MPRGEPRRQLGGELVREPVGEDRAQDRRAQRAADRAEQRGRRRGDAELRVGNGVLDREDQHLHARSPGPAPSTSMYDAASSDAGLRIQAPRAGSSPTAADRRADDGEDLVAPGPRDELAGPDRASRAARPSAGSSCRPEAVGLRPRTTCWNSGQVGERAEQGEPDHEAHQARERRRPGCERASSGSTGSGARCSTTTKAARASDRQHPQPDDRRPSPRRRLCRRASSAAPGEARQTPSSTVPR